jgi:succinate dehydrogenase/fumarate reductase cytochrome b subunit
MPKRAQKQPKMGNEPVCGALHSYERYLVKFGRFCAWSLIVFIFLYFISGWGVTRSGAVYNLTGGLLNRQTSFWLHDILTLPMAFAFLCHTLIAIRYALIRWNVKNREVLNYVFLGVGVVLFALVCWVYFS